MSEVALTQNTSVVVRLNQISAEPNSIYPTLRLEIEFGARGLEQVVLSNLTGRLSLRTTTGTHFLGMLATDVPLINLGAGGRSQLAFYCVIDHYGIAQIEKLRANRELGFLATLQFTYRTSTMPLPQLNWQGIGIEAKVAKSDWVETFLSSFKYKEVFLLEIPKVDGEEYADVTKYLDQAMKDLATGEFSSVLVDCQKAFEKVREIAVKKGFAQEKEIDFRKMVGENESTAEALDGILRKFIMFLQPGGRHIGRAINKEDAEFAMLLAFGLTNLIVRNLSS